MPTLTHNEVVVRDAVRDIATRVSPVAAYLVRRRVLESHGIRYDSTNRALTGLVQKNVLKKPKRGYYLP